jgi:hypothetical protein
VSAWQQLAGGCLIVQDLFAACCLGGLVSGTLMFRLSMLPGRFNGETLNALQQRTLVLHALKVYSIDMTIHIAGRATHNTKDQAHSLE